MENPEDIVQKYALILGEKYHINVSIRFTNRFFCSAGQDDSGNVFNISPDRVRFDYKVGWSEYKSLIKLWSRYGTPHNVITRYGNVNLRSEDVSPNMVGDEAMWALTLHEFAHVIAGNENNHNKFYQSVLAKLIRENPYKAEFWKRPKADWEIFLGL